MVLGVGTKVVDIRFVVNSAWQQYKSDKVNVGLKKKRVCGVEK